MKQQTFASQSSFERYGRKSRRELFGSGANGPGPPVTVAFGELRTKGE
jgi:hypothetical protein